MKLTREAVWGATKTVAPRFDCSPVQVGMGQDPWHVAVASVLLCRARGQQVREPLAELLSRWRWPMELCRADTDELEAVLRPCGLHRNRARQLTRMSCLWNSTAWEDLKDLPGVGVYVNDAVGLFCFGCTALEGTDAVLKAYAERSLAS